MSHFYGTISSNNSRKNATKGGNKATGLVTHAAGWNGAIRVTLRHNESTGKDEYTVELVPWENSGGISRELASGILDAGV